MPRLLVPLLSLRERSASGVSHAASLLPPLLERWEGESVALVTPFAAQLLRGTPARLEVHRLPDRRGVLLAAERILVPRAARRLRSDVLFVPDGQLLPGRRLPPAVVALHHHLNFSRPQGQRLSQRVYWKLWYDRALRRSCARAAALVAPTAAFAREMEGLVPEAGGRLRVVPHGVSERFRPEGPVASVTRGSPCVLLVGNADHYKNVAGGVRAFLEAAAGLPHVLLVAGVDEERLRALLRASAPGSEAEVLAGRVRALGRLPLARLPELYRGASAVLHASLVESFGLPVLEAMACGTPVAAFDLPALKEVGGEAVGWAPAGDHRALARELRPLLVDSKLAARRRAAGLERARDLTWDAAAERIVGILEEVAG